MMTPMLALMPLGMLAYISSNRKPDNSETHTDQLHDLPWTQNNTDYLKEPLAIYQTRHGDLYEYETNNPTHPVPIDNPGFQSAMSDENIMRVADYERKRDEHTYNLWPQFLRPRHEIQTRDSGQPIKIVSLFEPGGWLDMNVPSGIKYYEEPMPESTSLQHYYPTEFTQHYIYKPYDPINETFYNTVNYNTG